MNGNAVYGINAFYMNVYPLMWFVKRFMGEKQDWFFSQLKYISLDMAAIDGALVDDFISSWFNIFFYNSCLIQVTELLWKQWMKKTDTSLRNHDG